MFVNLALLTFALCFTLLLVEAGFRSLIYLSKDSPIRSPRPRLYFIPSNSVDLRGFPEALPKGPNTYRVAVIGDSIAFGPHLQFDDTFPKRLERLLNLENPNPRVEIVNYGTPGYSTFHELQSAKKAVDQGADMLLLQFYFNDPEIAPPSATTPEYVQKFVFDPQWPILKYWRSLNFIVERLHNSSTRTAYTKYFFKLFEEPASWNKFSSSIAALKRLAATHNVPLLCVIFPLMGFEMDKSYPFHPLHQKVHEQLEKEGIQFVDLYSTYSGIPITSLHVLPGKDHHPNEVGHRLAAESIYLWLENTAILGPQYFAADAYLDRTTLAGKKVKPERKRKIAAKAYLN